jgi:hypothetical protein
LINLETNGVFVLVPADKFELDSTPILDPFRDYLKRDFYIGPISRYYLNEIPGHVFRKENDGTYTRISGRRLVLNNYYPEVKIVDKVYFSSAVNNSVVLKAAAAILKMEISDDQSAELILKDDAVCYLNDTLLNEELIKQLATKVGQTNLDKYYIAKAAGTSSIISKFYKKQKFKADVDASWLTVGGSTYSSRELFKQKIDVTMELISLKDYMILISAETIPGTPPTNDSI